jgi:hypothetical protein
LASKWGHSPTEFVIGDWQMVICHFQGKFPERHRDTEKTRGPWHSFVSLGLCASVVHDDHFLISMNDDEAVAGAQWRNPLPASIQSL